MSSDRTRARSRHPNAEGGRNQTGHTVGQDAGAHGDSHAYDVIHICCLLHRQTDLRAGSLRSNRVVPRRFSFFVWLEGEEEVTTLFPVFVVRFTDR